MYYFVCVSAKSVFSKVLYCNLTLTPSFILLYREINGIEVDKTKVFFLSNIFHMHKDFTSKVIHKMKLFVFCSNRKTILGYYVHNSNISCKINQHKMYHLWFPL